MTRIKRGKIAHLKHKKILKLAKGYYGARSRVYRVANQAVIKAHQYAYRDRKQRKRIFRNLWIVRINASLKPYGISYNKFIYWLKICKIKLNRKYISNLSINKPTYFNQLVNYIQKTKNSVINNINNEL